MTDECLRDEDGNGCCCPKCCSYCAADAAEKKAARFAAIKARLEGWRENCAEEGGDEEIVAIFELHAADDIAWLLEVACGVDGGHSENPELTTPANHE